MSDPVRDAIIRDLIEGRDTRKAEAAVARIRQGPPPTHAVRQARDQESRPTQSGTRSSGESRPK